MYTIRLRFARIGYRFAGTRCDWAKEDRHTILFTRRADAEQFMRMHIWERGAEVVYLPY